MIYAHTCPNFGVASIHAAVSCIHNKVSAACLIAQELNTPCLAAVIRTRPGQDEEEEERVIDYGTMVSGVCLLP